MRIDQQFGETGRARLAALLAVVALLVQALMPAAAMAAQASSGETLVICTVDGMRTIAVDGRGQPVKKGFAGLPCADCLASATVATSPPKISVQPVTYVLRPVVHVAEAVWIAPRARAPPRPFSQAPPTL